MCGCDRRGSGCAVVAGLFAVVFAVGCTGLRGVVDAGLDARAAYEQRKADEKAEKERLRLAEEQAARDRVAAEAAAKEEEEAKLRAQYAAGPNTLEHGRRGFLWKPKSDNDGFPVVIIPPRFSHKTRLVMVDGQRLKVSGKPANGYREHYRMRRHFPAGVPITVVAEASDGEGGPWYRWTWVVADPSVRNDSNITPSMERVQ